MKDAHKNKIDPKKYALLKRLEQAGEETFDASIAERLSLDDSVSEEEYRQFLKTGKVPRRTMSLVVQRQDGEILAKGALIPSEVGGLQIEKRIGKGIFGRVYLARDGQGQPYAVKFIEPKHTKSREFTERFLLECNILKYLNDCPFTVKVYGRRVPKRSVRFETFDADGNRVCEYLRTPYVVMDYIEGSRNMLAALPWLREKILGRPVVVKNSKAHRRLMAEYPQLQQAVLQYVGAVAEQVADLLVCLSRGKSIFIQVPQAVYGSDQPGYRSPRSEVDIKAVIIHRDLKPHNILLRLHDQPQSLVRADQSVLQTRFTVAVSDFGLAKPVHSRLNLTVVGEILGARFYMPPEQISAAEIDGRADVFALGCSMCHLIFGEPLYAELWRKITKHHSNPRMRDMLFYNEIKKGKVTISSQFKEWKRMLKGQTELLHILEKAAHPDVTKRYTAFELREVLRQYNQRLQSIGVI